MAGRPIRSALLIDIENVSYARLSTSIPNWLAWLEDGQFDPAKQRRKFVLKRAYWNSTSEHDRKKFESRGIDAILVDRYVTLKNTADVHMAIDMIELLHTRPDIEEYVLLSKDSDFIPVMQRLRAKHKKTVMLVDLASPTLHTAFRDKVDIVIPHRDLLLATVYNPPLPKLGMIGRWRARMATKREQARIDLDAKQLANNEPLKTATSANGSPNSGSSAGLNGTKVSFGKATELDPTPIKLPDGTPLQQAAILIGALLKPSRGLYVPQKAILTQLKAIPEFSELGTAKYLGFGSYHALMSQLAADDPLMKVDQQNGGHAAVRYLSMREQQHLKAAAVQPSIPAKPRKAADRDSSTRSMTAAVFPAPAGFTVEQEHLLAAAIREVRRVALLRPGAYLPRQGLLDAIGAVPGISIEPPDDFLGTGSLSGFMFEVARRDTDFYISEETGGGKGYRYIPRMNSNLPASVPKSVPASVPKSADDVAHAPTPVPALPPLISVTGGRSLQVEIPQPLQPMESAGRNYDIPQEVPGSKRWDLT
jgi:uncharacterized LabA/DUF88 family protein